MKNKAIAKSICLIFGLALILATAHAGIVGPYTVDSDTLHLWHFDEAESPVNDAVSGGVTVYTTSSGSTLGNTGFTGFGTAGNTSADAGSIFRSSVISPGPVVAPVGTGGAFTYEAMINISTTGSGNQTIFAMDANANANRSFLFRLNNGDLDFFNLKEGSLTHATAALPTTGDDVFVANEWFHAAVTYDGNEGTAGNMKLYWTRVDGSRTQANLIYSDPGTMIDLSTTALAIYGIGNDYRTVGSGNVSNLEGSIDEVRISGIARSADDMLFTIPEPASLGLVAIAFAGLFGLRRRFMRKRDK